MEEVRCNGRLSKISGGSFPSVVDRTLTYGSFSRTFGMPTKAASSHQQKIIKRTPWPLVVKVAKKREAMKEFRELLSTRKREQGDAPWVQNPKRGTNISETAGLKKDTDVPKTVVNGLNDEPHRARVVKRSAVGGSIKRARSFGQLVRSKSIGRIEKKTKGFSYSRTPPSPEPVPETLLSARKITLPHFAPTTPLTDLFAIPTTPQREYPDSPLLLSPNIDEIDAWDDIRKAALVRQPRLSQWWRQRTRGSSRLAAALDSPTNNKDSDIKGRKSSLEKALPPVPTTPTKKTGLTWDPESTSRPPTPSGRETSDETHGLVTPKSSFKKVLTPKRSPKTFLAGVCRALSPKKKITVRDITPLTPISPRSARILLPQFDDYF